MLVEIDSGVVWLFSSITDQVTTPGFSIADGNDCTGFPTSISLVAGLPFTCSNNSVALILFEEMSFDTILLLFNIIIVVVETVVLGVEVGGSFVVRIFLFIDAMLAVVISGVGFPLVETQVEKRGLLDTDKIDAGTELNVLNDGVTVVVLKTVATVEILLGLDDEPRGLFVSFDVVGIFFVVTCGFFVVVPRVILVVNFVGFWDGLIAGGFVILVGFAVDPKKYILVLLTVYGELWTLLNFFEFE